MSDSHPLKDDSQTILCHCFSASSQLLDKTASNLTGMGIKELEANSSWHIIDLSQNSIEFVEFPELLRKQSHLETLRLNFNPFNARGNEQIFAHETLMNFECNACGFVEILSQHFAGLVSLRELRLNANRINQINENAFRSNEDLKVLDLSGNQLRVLPHSTFVGLRSFEDLRLPFNPIDLPVKKPFLKSDSLKRLEMNDCQLPSIHPETFIELRNLELLDLNRNQIELLPVNSFKQNLKLKSLFFESNRLRSFQSTILDFLPQIAELCIDNNTFIDSPDFAKLAKKYDDSRLRTDKCNSNVDFFIEGLFSRTPEEQLSMPVEEIDDNGNGTEKSSKFVKKYINEGVSDFFIGSYITFIIILQAIAFVLLSIYLLKISKYEKLDGESNFANTILNNDEIYRVYKSNQ